jgi:hypothetical protein
VPFQTRLHQPARGNFKTKEKFPLAARIGVTCDSGTFESARDQQVRGEQRRVNAGGETLTGIGHSAAGGGIGWESGTVRFVPSGKVTVLTPARGQCASIPERALLPVMIHQLPQEVEHVARLKGLTGAHRLRRRERPATGELREAVEARLLLGGEQVVAPDHGGPQRLLPREWTSGCRK